MTTRNLVAAIVLSCLFAAFLAPVPQAGTKSTQKEFAEPTDDKALAYFVRAKRFTGSGRTMFLYAGDQFLGVLDNDSYTYAHVEPGEQMLWLNWAKISRNFEFEAGQTYYFEVWDTILEVGEEAGRRKIDGAKNFCQPTDKEIATSDKHLRERYGKAAKHAKKESGEHAGRRADREKHIAKWPKVDLSNYTALVIEDFEVTDPKAGNRKDQDLLQTAPSRVANMVKSNLDKGTFELVLRGEVEDPPENAMILRVELTQYKPGSKAGRFMIAGAGAARLDFQARIICCKSGKELATFSDQRAYGWGGAMGVAGGIETIETNLAYELAEYLERQVRGAARDPASSEPG